MNQIAPRAGRVATTSADAAAVPPVDQWLRTPRMISVISPVFMEEKGIAHFVANLHRVLVSLGVPFEIIFVEDDSPDGTLEQIRSLRERYPEVKCLSLSRRFGHQASLAAGLQYAAGDVVLTMDSDMQHPPALLPLLLWQWSQGYQVVYTRRRVQEGRSRWVELASRWFYRIMDELSEITFEEGTADFRLMDRVVVDALLQFSERSLFYRGLISWVGFHRIAVDYNAAERFAGASSFTLRRMVKLAADSLFAFSQVPLRLSYYLGATGLVLGGGHSLSVLIKWLLGMTDVAGYTSTVMLVTLMGSLNLLCLGIMGEYIGRIYEQVKGRPVFLVKEHLGLIANKPALPALSPLDSRLSRAA